jgi:signal transduction histidine kinase
VKNVFFDHIRNKEVRFEDRALYDAMSDGFVIITKDSLEIEYSNRSFEDFENELERSRVVKLLKMFVKGDISEENILEQTDYSRVGIKNVNLDDGTVAYLIILIKSKKMPFAGHYEILNEAEDKIGMGTWQYLIPEDEISFSNGMAHIFGFKEGHERGFARKLVEYLSYVRVEDQDKIKISLQYIIETGMQVNDVEHHITDIEGNEKMVSISTLKTLENKGEIYGVQGIIRDITKSRKHELVIEENIRKLNASNEALSEFAYTASHDLQEPLRKIEAYGDRLRDSLGEKLSDKSERYLEKMLSATGRMSGLIDDILKLSRLSSTNIVSEPVSLNEVFKGIISDYEETINRTSAAISYDLPYVTGSRTQLHQLFQNLLGNALKFRRMNENPVVTVSHRPVEKEEMKEHGLDRRLFYTVVSFKDNGIGFEQQFENKIFAPFKRLFGRSEFPGTGIGLAIVKKVVENHNGIIRVRSQEGVGTTFYIYLPIP